MNTEQLKTQWETLKSDVSERWSKLSELDVGDVKGDADALIAKVQDKYELGRDAAEQQVNEWMSAAERQLDEKVLKTRWKEVKGHAKEQWGKLTDDDLREVEGNIERLEAKLRQRYELTSEKARQKVSKFLENVTSKAA